VTRYKVTLLSVTGDEAKFQVNKQKVKVEVGELFTNDKLGPFKLIRVGEIPGGATAKVQFGSATPVELDQKDAVVFQP
jgi:hypothetical protein